MEAGGGGQWWPWALACRETALWVVSSPQALPRLPSAGVSIIRVSLGGPDSPHRSPFQGAVSCRGRAVL